jgi:hypothetical protein
MRVEYKKAPLIGRAKYVMRPGQGQSLEWEETKPERISNIQANLGGCRGGSERVAWRRGRRPLIRGVPDQGLRLVDSRGEASQASSLASDCRLSL